MNNKTPLCIAAVGAILMAGSLTGEVWAQEAPQAPAPPTALSETAPLDTSAMNVEEMEAKLQEMNAQLQTLSAELERTNKQSRELVEQALILVREQQNQPTTATEKALKPPAPPTPPAPAMKIKLNLPDAPDTAVEIEQAQLDQQAAIFEAQQHAMEAQQQALEGQQQSLEAQQSISQEKLQRFQQKAQRQAARVLRRAPGSSGARTLFSGNGMVEAGETVEEFVLFSGNGEVVGNVEGDAVLLAGNLLVRSGAHIGGDAVVLAGNLSVEEGAVIEGDTVVTAGKLDVEDGAIIGGDQVQMGLGHWSMHNFPKNIAVHIPDNHVDVEAEAFEDMDVHEDGLLDSLSQILTRFLLLSGAGLLLMTFLPSRTQAVGRTVNRRLGAAAFTGLLASFSLLPLSLLMAVSIVGIPLVPIVLGMASFAVVLGLAAASLEIGRRLPLKRQAPAWLLAAGAGVLAIVSEVPVLGPVGMIFLSFVGLGAVLLSRFGETDTAAEF